MDTLGRVRVRFDFQQGLDGGGSTTRTSPWVRVAQAWAGAGHGAQFIPRLGQRVLVRDDTPSPSRGTPSRRQRTAASVLPGWVSAALRRQAARSGYANRFADNHRGSFRGTGFELRTDAYAALRAGQGLLITTALTPAQEPAQDSAPGIARGKQLAQLAQAFDQATGTQP